MDHREHLTPLDVAALVEDELAQGDIYRCWDHLAECPACTWFLVTVITMGEPETEEEWAALDRMRPVTMEDVRRKLRQGEAKRSS